MLRMCKSRDKTHLIPVPQHPIHYTERKPYVREKVHEDDPLSNVFISPQLWIHPGWQMLTASVREHTGSEPPHHYINSTPEGRAMPLAMIYQQYCKQDFGRATSEFVSTYIL